MRPSIVVIAVLFVLACQADRLVRTPESPHPQNRAPRASSGGPYEGEQGDEILFSASGSSDPDADSLSYRWLFGDGRSGAGMQVVHQYRNTGTFSASVIVTDSWGAADTARSMVTVREYTPPPPPPPPGNRAPIAVIGGPYTGVEGATIQVSASQSYDPDGNTLLYTWSFGDSTVGYGWDGTNLYSGRWVVFTDNGAYPISVIVTDPSGLSDTATTVVSVANAPPQVTLSSEGIQVFGRPTTIGITVTDLGRRDSYTIAITWGDGTSVTTELAAGADSSGSQSTTASHTYAAVGWYVIRAAVRDKDGGARDTSTTLAAFDPESRAVVAGYVATDLGTLGGISAVPSDVNDYGQVVGSSATASGTTHAFLWDNGVLHDLGALGWGSSSARRINNAGLIAGSVRSTDYGSSPVAAIWQDGVGRVLESVREEFGVSAGAINESGDIAWNAHGHEDDYAWLWRGGVWQRLGALIHPLAHAYSSSINERGQIVGTSAAVSTGESPWPTSHAFLWETDVMRDLGLLAFKPCPSYPDKNCGYAAATSINENGQVVGFSTAADGSNHAVLWENGTIRDLWTVANVGIYTTQRVVINDRGQAAGSARGEGFFWSDGALHPLGSLGGGRTEVVDMNEAGLVAGTSMTANGEQHAFVWTRDRGMVDLGTGPHGFTGAWVVGISYYGDIVGYTAPCDVRYYPECGYPTRTRAVIWRTP